MANYDDIFRNTSRVVAFSDGVFAIAITLLVIDIKVPPHLESRGALWESLLAEWPDFAAYLTSFATIGTMWMSHHFLFLHIRKVDTLLFYLNLIVLALITFIPVPTSLVAEYLGTPGQHLAGFLYTGTFLVISIAFTILWHHAAQERHLISDTVPNGVVKAITQSYRVQPLWRLAALVLSAINVYASMVITLGLAVYFTGPAKPPRRRMIQRARAERSQH